MIDLNKALFFDIESHRVKNWDERSSAFQKAFINHYYDSTSYSSPEEHYSEIAGLYAELSQVICVVFGFINPATDSFIMQEVHGEDEVKILQFCKKIFDGFGNGGYFLVGYNSDTCDIPYLVKRYILNDMTVPPLINLQDYKPWEVPHWDIMKLWQCGDYKRTSLEMLCAAMNIDCKTDQLGGDNLYQYDIKDMDWDQLVHYCKQDVESLFKATVQINKYYR